MTGRAVPRQTQEAAMTVTGTTRGAQGARDNGQPTGGLRVGVGADCELVLTEEELAAAFRRFLQRSWTPRELMALHVAVDQLRHGAMLELGAEDVAVVPRSAGRRPTPADQRLPVVAGLFDGHSMMLGRDGGQTRAACTCTPFGTPDGAICAHQAAFLLVEEAVLGDGVPGTRRARRAPDRPGAADLAALVRYATVGVR